MSNIKILTENWLDAIFGDMDDFKLIERSITNTYRHGTCEYVIVKSLDGKYYRCYFRVPSDDCNDSIGDSNEDYMKWTEVKPFQKTITDWEDYRITEEK